MILYAPRSAFENQTYARYRQAKPISVPDRVGIPEYKTPEYRKKRPRPESSDAAQSTADSGASYQPGRAGVAALDNNWYLNYGSVKVLLPLTSAVEPLRKLYDGVAESAAEQIAGGVNASDSLAFKSGPFSLQLSSREPINWSFVINLAQDRVGKLSNSFAPLFRAEAVNVVWDLAPVQVSLDLMS